LTAKNVDPLNNGVDANSVEAGPQEWAVTCGVCHVGGGQMEYNRDLLSYASTTTKSGDRYYWQLPRLGEAGGLRDAGTGGLGAVINDTNKAEVDCLMCHLHDNTNSGGNGYAWYQSMGCDAGNPIGPANDPTCSGTNSGMYAGSALPAVVPFAAGTKYDMFNRNLAIKTPSYKIADARFDYAGSMGIGAIGTIVGGKVTGITGMPTTILGANIQATPNSQNCAVCHARDDNTVGLPGMAAMKFGYGNYLLEIAAGEALSQQTTTDTTTANAVEWKDFGCKTGMGKRAHKVGAGLNDKWGMSMFVPSTFNGTCNHADKPCAGDPIVGKMPDADVHSIAPRSSTGFTAGQPTGIECGTCHFALGSMKSSPTSSMTGTGESQAEYFAPSTHHGVAYQGIYIQAIDHNFAQGDSSPDTKARNNFDGTVSCESCHTTRTHPRLTDNGGTMVSPTPTHAGFPAIHIQKIACTTCHIPEVYAAPGRLKYRDWTTGFYKNGQRNMLDWNYDLVTGSHNTVPMVHAWLTKYGEKKIYPFLPSILPIWMQTITNSGTIAGSEVGATFDGTPPSATQVAVAKSREVTDAFLTAKAAGTLPITRINQGNMVPLFDGFSLADSWAIDTKAKIDAMVTAGAGKLTKVQLHNTLFDATHGVAPKEWALGAVARGGCVSCHSSMNPRDLNYSPQSTGFFEGYEQPVNKAGAGIGAYDFVKNWFAMFADYDCTAMSNGMHSSQSMCQNMCMYQMGKSSAECSQFCAPIPQLYFAPTGSVMPDTGTGWSDGHYFDPMTGNPINVQRNAQGQVELNPNGSCYGDLANCDPFLTACVNLMASTFDVAMGFPAGTAGQMGMNDGIAGLQGFVIRETASGMTPCNPFAGPINFSPMGANANVNACIPNPAQPAPAPGYPTGAMYAGTCTGPTVVVQGMTVPTCVGGFRAGGPCGGVADCQGSMASPMPLLYSRGEMRNQFKIDLQQSNPGTGNRLTWPISVEKNPSNPAHVNSWDQAVSNCITNPLTGATGPCADGMSVSTKIPANALLGYTPSSLAYLKGLGASLATYLTQTTPASALPVARFSYMISRMTVTFDASASSAPTGTAPILSYSWNFGDGITGTGKNPAAVTYLTTGTKTIVLTVANANGTSQKSMSIKLDPSAASLASVPTASFSIDPFTDMTVTITPIVSSNTATVFVNWGDGIASTLTSTSAAVPHTYGVKGTYRIILAASNSFGGTATIGRTVTVPVMATISGTVSSGTGTLDAFITVYSNVTGAPLVASTYSGGASGSYSVSVPSGTYTVKAAKYGYVFADQIAVVTAPTGTTVNFIGTAITPVALYSISGTIDSAPVGLLVTCHPTGSVVVLGAQFTNGVGFFNFTGLASGTYDIRMDLSTGVTSSRTVTITNASQVISAGTWTYN
jgi:PKD repeat protein